MYLCIPYIPLAKLTVLNISSMSSLRQCFLTASQMCWMKAEPYVSWVYEPVSASKQNQIISVVRRCLIVLNVTYWRVVHLQVVLEWKMMKSFSLCVRGPLPEFTDRDSMSSVGTNCSLSSKSADSSPTETNTQTYWNVSIFYLFKWTNINSKFIEDSCMLFVGCVRTDENHLLCRREQWRSLVCPSVQDSSLCLSAERFGQVQTPQFPCLHNTPKSQTRCLWGPVLGVQKSLSEVYRSSVRRNPSLDHLTSL